MIWLLWACQQSPRPAPAPGAFPHVQWTQILQKSVDTVGRVDYKGLQEHPEELRAYTALLAAYGPDNHPELFPDRTDQLAYWLNAYNANVIAGVVDWPGLISVGQDKITQTRFFYLSFYEIGGSYYSLHGLENDVIRAQFQDPRVHFALNCDSMGCPRLPQEAFVPERLEQQLDAAALEFVNNPQKVRVEGNTLYVSQIFEWYAGDFKEGIEAFIRARRELPPGLTIAYIPYDWSLIAQEGRGP